MRRLIPGLLVFVFILSIYGAVFIHCQEAQKGGNEVVLSGAVQEIAEDGSYIIVGDKKIITTPKFLEDYLLAEGDEVAITARKTPKGLQAEDCDFMLDAAENIEEYIEDTKAVGEDE